MVAIVSGDTLGLTSSSRNILGGAGQSGNSSAGQSGEQVFVNSVTGNLVIQDRDEVLTGIGIRDSLMRTYNSQGLLDDDNGDNWRLGVHQRLSGLTGTVNTGGSTVTKTFGDGAQLVYTYITALSKYVSDQGDGAHDTLAFNSGNNTWTWTDGSARNTETYDVNGRLNATRDQDGNQLTYIYTGSLLTEIVDSSATAQHYYFDYTGTNLSQIRVESSGVIQTLTRYFYDGSNRLSQVKVDLSPAADGIADGKVYVTTYTYEGTSRRVASITQTDGTSVNFTYVLVDGSYRVKTFTDGAGNVSTLNYVATAPGGGSSTTVNANTGVLQTTEPGPGSTTYNINNGVLTPEAGYTTLYPGVPLQSLSGPKGAMTFYKVEVPAGASALYFRSRSGTGDVDLWAKPGSPPTMFDYEASSVGDFTDEMVYVQNPTAGTWYVGVHAWEAYSGLELSASVETDAGGVQVLTAGIAVNDVQAKAEEAGRDFSFVVPAGTSSVTVTLTGNSGDLDIYARHGALATVETNDVRSDGETSNEKIVISNPTAGTWYVHLAGWVTATDASLVVHYNLGSNTPPTVEAGPPQSVASAASVTLVGTGSDAQGAVSYQWTQISGPTVTLSNANTANAAFTAPAVSSGTLLLFRLTVTDSNGVTNTDIARVVVGATTVPMNPTNWTTPVVLETGSGAVSELRASSNNAGFVFATWIQNNALYSRIYDPRIRAWTPAQLVGGASTTPVDSSLSMDLEIGTAVLVWRNSATGEIYSNRFAYSSSTSTYEWRGAEVIATVSAGVAVTDLSAGISDAGVTAVIWTETNGSTKTLKARRHSGTAWGSTQTVATSTATLDSARVAVSTDDLIQIVWRASSGSDYIVQGRAHDGTSWLSTRQVSAEAGPVSNLRIMADGGATLFVWTYGSTLMGRYGFDNLWSGSTFGEATSAVTSLASVNQGNVDLYAWATTDGSLCVSSTAFEGIQVLARGTAISDVRAFSNSETEMTVTWRDGNDVYVATYHSGAWSSPKRLETGSGATSSAYAFTSNDFDSTHSDEAAAVWLQNDGTTTNVYFSRFKHNQQLSALAPHYTVQPDDTWATVAQAVYGNSSVATQLATALGNPTLSEGLDLVGFPPSLSSGSSGTITVPAYYVVPSGATWASVTQAIYGTSDAAAVAALQVATSNPALTAGLHLTVPLTLTYVGSGGSGTPGFSTEVSITNALGLVTTVSNDGSGRLLGIESPAVGGTRLETRFGYSPAGNVTSITEDPDGLNRVTALEYDDRGNLLSTRDAAGNTVTRTYDSNNQLLSETLYLVPDPDGAGSGQASVPQTTRYVYDSEQHLRFVISALGRVTEHQYNAVGQRTLTRAFAAATYSSTNSAENDLATWAGQQNLTLIELSSYGYDFRGNVSTVTQYSSTSSAGAGAGTPSITRFVYDQRGQLLQKIEARGESTAATNDYITAYTYDGLGRLLSTTQWIGGSVMTPVRNGGFETGSAEGGQSNPGTVATGNVYNGAYSVRIDSGAGGPATIAERFAVTPGDNFVAEAFVMRNPAGLPTNAISLAIRVYDASGNPMGGRVVLQSASVSTDGWQKLTGSYTVPAGAAFIAVDVGGATGTGSWLVDDVAITRPAVTTLYQYDDANHRIITTEASGAISTSVYNGNGDLISISKGASVATGAGTSLSTIRYTYDAAGRLRITTDEVGTARHFIYDEASRKVGEVDGDGTLTQFIYDRFDQLVKTIRFADRLAPATVATLVDAQGNPANVSIATLVGLVPTTVGRGSDQIARIVYDAAGRQVFSIDETGAVQRRFYDGAGRMTDEVSYATRISIDRAVNELSVGDISVPIDVTDRRVRHFYDADGKLRGTLDALGYLIEFTYDAAGHLSRQYAYANQTNSSLWLTGTLSQLIPAADNETATDYERDIVSYFFYDGQGRRIGVLDAEGYFTETSYDLAGQVKDVKRYDRQLTYTAGVSTFQTLRTAASVAPVTVHTTSYEYDGAGRVTRETNYEGTVTAYRYDAVGNLVSSTRALGDALDVRTTQARYDLLGRVAQELTAEGSAKILAGMTPAQIDAVWAQYGVTHAYDLAGRRVSTTDQYGNKTLFYYDADNRLAYAVNPRGEVTESKYNALGQVTDQIGYVNRIGDLTGLTGGAITSTLQSRVIANPQDSLTTFTYDLAGRIATQATATGSSVAHLYNAFGQERLRTTKMDSTRDLEQKYTYDVRGLLRTTQSDPNGLNITESRDYDSFGRLSNVTDALSHVQQYQYDRLGLLRVSKNPNNFVTSTEYDAFGRVESITDALINVTSYAYDDSARSVVVTSPEGIFVTTIHNRHGQTSSVLDERRAGVTDEKLNTTTYEYDENGQLKKIYDLRGVLSQQAYDRAGRLDTSTDGRGIVTKLTYDAASRVLTGTEDYGDTTHLNLVTTYTYDALGRATDVNAPGSRLTHTDYDRDGRVILVTVDSSGANERTQYGYDFASNLTSMIEGYGSANPHRVKYVYDVLGRRTHEYADSTDLGGVLNLHTEYRYDNDGNLVRQIDASGYSTWYVYDDADRLKLSLQTLDVAKTKASVTETLYDANDRVVTTRHYVNAIDVPTVDRVTNVNLTQNPYIAEQTVYDKDGRAVYSIDANYTVTERGFDSNGNVTVEHVYAKRLTPGVYSTANGVAADLGSASGVIAVGDRVRRSVYDERNRIEFSIAGSGAVTSYQYDANGNIISQTQFANRLPMDNSVSGRTEVLLRGDVSALGNPAKDRTTRFWYDNTSRVRFTLDAEGYLKETRYLDATRQQVDIVYASKPTTINGASALGTVVNAAAALPTSGNETKATLFDVAGRVKSITRNVNDSASVIESYTYDAVGNKKTYTNANGQTWDYQYDGNRRLIWEDAPAVDVTTLAGGDGAIVAQTPSNVRLRTTYDYDARGNLISRIEAQNTAWSRATGYVYDGAGRQIKTVFAAVGVYDPNGDSIVSANPTRHETISSLWTEVDYDALGNAWHSKDVSGYDSYKLYDAEGRITYEIDAERYVTGYTYDAFGNQVELRRYAAPYAGALPTSGTSTISVPESGDDRVVTTVYDRLNRKINVKQSAVDVWDPNPAASGVGGAGYTAQPETIYEYDAFGNMIRERALATRVGGENRYADTYHYYDRLGNKTADVDALGYLTTYQYDEVGNLTGKKEYAAKLQSWDLSAAPSSPTANPTENLADLLNISGLSVFGAAASKASGAEAWDSGFRSRIGYAGGATVSFTVLQNNRYLSVGLNSDPTADHSYASIDWSMHAAVDGHIYAFENGVNQGDLGVYVAGDVLSVSYDGSAVRYIRNGVVLRTVSATITQPLYADAGFYSVGGAITNILFSGVGSDDRETVFTYDALGRQTSETLVSSSTSGLVRDRAATSYGYDGVGNRTSVTANGATTYTYYDNLGRAIALVEPTRDADGTAGTVSITPLTVMRRDAFGNLVQMIQYASGVTRSVNGVPVGTAWNAAGNPDLSNPDRETLTSYDLQGHAVQVRDANGAHSFTSYTARGDVAKEWTPVANVDTVIETLVTRYTYDKIGRLIKLEEPQTLAGSAAGEVIVVRNVTYNAFGEITSNARAGAPADQAEINKYDGAGRLWFSNSGDGVAKIYLYNLAGQSTAVIKSQSTDLSTKTLADVALDLPGVAQMRTETVYDLLGRVVSQREVSFTTDSRIDAMDSSFQVGRPTGGALYLYWTAPPPQTIQRLQWRQGSGDWSTAVTPTVVGSGFGWDVSSFRGSYEFRVTVTRIGDSQPYAIHTGTFAVNETVTNSASVDPDPAVTGVFGVAATIQGSNVKFTWNFNTPGPDVFLEVKRSTDTQWQTYTAAYESSSGRMTATASMPVATTYDYRITFGVARFVVSGGQGSITIPNTVTTTVSGATPDPSWGDAVGPISASGSTTPGAPGEVNVTWPALSPFPGSFEYFWVDTAQGPVYPPQQSNSAGGVVRLQGNLSPGTYTWHYERVAYDMNNELQTIDTAYGTLVFNGVNSSLSKTAGGGPLMGMTVVPPTPTKVNVQLTWAAHPGLDFPTVYIRPHNTSGPPWFPGTSYTPGTGWEAVNRDFLPDGTPRAYFTVPQAGLYDYFYWYGNNNTATGTFVASETSPYVTVTPGASSPSFLTTVSAGGSYLNWNRALQSGETLTVTINGANYTPEPFGGGFYRANFYGYPSGSYRYEVTYWKNGQKFYSGTGSVYIETTTAQPPATVVQPTTFGTVANLQDAGGNTGRLAWTTPANPGDRVEVQYREVGAQNWIVPPLTPVAWGSGFAVTFPQPGWYWYEVSYYAQGQTRPYRIASGRVTITSTPAVVASGLTNTTSAAPERADLTLTTRVQQVFDRWNNTTAVTDALGFTTDYRFNARDQVIEIKSPEVGVVSTRNGQIAAATNLRPTTRNYYDEYGRLVAKVDANSNLSRIAYNEADQVISETTADSTSYSNTVTGTKYYRYNAFGERVEVVDELGFLTRSVIDRVGNVVATAQEVAAGALNSASSIYSIDVAAASVLTHVYTYDQAGRRKTETSGALMDDGATAESTKYHYDLLGNVIKRTTPRGFVTRYEYDPYGNGKQTKQVDAIGGTMTWEYDAWGRLRRHTDIVGETGGEADGALSEYLYNSAGLLWSVTDTRGRNTKYYFDEAGHVSSIVDGGTPTQAGFNALLVAVDRTTSYSYDAVGRVTGERIVDHGVIQQDTETTYDALGRIVHLSDPRYTLSYEYDTAGNRTHISANYFYQNGIATSSNLWYTYDGANRVTISQGESSNGVVVTGGHGIALTYTKRGERETATQKGLGLSHTYGIIAGTGISIDRWETSSDEGTEKYHYDGAGRLVRTEKQAFIYYNDPNDIFNGPSLVDVTWQDVDMRDYDGASRMISQTQKDPENVNSYTIALATRVNSFAYDDNGWIKSRTTTKQVGSDAVYQESSVIYGDSQYSETGWTGTTHYDPFGQPLWYTSDGPGWNSGYDQAGNLRAYQIVIYNSNGSTARSSNYSLTYRSGDGYQERTQTVSNTAGTSATPYDGFTSRTYNLNGELVQFSDRDQTRNRYFANNSLGQAINVVQGSFGNSHPTGEFSAALAAIGASNDHKLQSIFVVNGERIGSIQSAGLLAQFTANFDVNYTPISDDFPSSAPSEVVAQEGDTLRKIAVRVFGDGALWYLIAQENGLAEPDESIDTGRVLRIPNEVVSLANNSSTFKPYDVREALGDTTPAQPMPPQPTSRGKKGCGVIGQIIIIVVAIVVTYITAGAASTAFSGALGAFGGAVAGGAVGGAVGAVASQSVAIALGMQNGFDWKGIATAAITAAVAAGIGKAGALAGAPESAEALRTSKAVLAFGDAVNSVGAIGQAAAGSILSQGISVAAGLQKSFSWKEVAITAVSAPITDTVGNAIGASVSGTTAEQFGRTARSARSGTANFASDVGRGLTSIGVRSALGGKIDTASVLADVFGNAIGNSLVAETGGATVRGPLDATMGAADELTEVEIAARRIPVDASGSRFSGAATSRDELGSTNLQLATTAQARTDDTLVPSPVAEVVVTGTYTGTDPEVMALLAARQHTGWMETTSSRQFVGPIKGNFLVSALEGFGNSLARDWRNFTQRATSGEPILTGPDILHGGANLLKGAASLVSDSLVEKIPGAEFFEFGIEASARNSARGQAIRDSIAGGVKAAAGRAELITDLALAGDSVSAGALFGEAQYELNKFAAKEAVTTLAPLGIGRLGRLGAIGELGLIDDFGQAAGGTEVLFGQRRLSERFSRWDPEGDGPPDYLAGRTIHDVAKDLRSGFLSPDQISIEAFRYGDDLESLVSANTRSLAALSLAGLRPTNITLISPSRDLLRRLNDRPVHPESPLPGPRIPVTPSRSDLRVLDVVEIPRR